MSTVAIIQARMGASRLPNKMFLNLHGHPIVEWVFRRVQQSKQVDQVIVALPNTENDDILAWYLESIGATLFRGSEMDLVDRFYQAAKQERADQVVRVCADNPLICASEIDRLITFYKENPCDYAYNHIPKNSGYPDGLGAEICNFSLLEEIYLQAITLQHREHLFNYILEHEVHYNIKTINAPEAIAFPHLKLDLDTLEDYRALLQKPYKIDMTAEEIVNCALSLTS